MQVKDEKKEQKIIQAVSQIILENGLSNVSISAVASKVGISKGTIYIYFHNKQAMLKTAYMVNRQHYNDYLTTHTNLDDQRSPKDQLSSFIDNLYQFGQLHPEELMIVDAIVDSPLRARFFPNGQEPDEFLTPWRQIIDRGKARGQFKLVDSYAIHFFIFHTVCDYFKDLRHENFTQQLLPYDQLKALIMSGICV